MLTLGGTSDVGWGVEHEANLPGQQSVCTVTEYARFRLLLPELQVDAQGSLQRETLTTHAGAAACYFRFLEPAQSPPFHWAGPTCPL